MRPFLEVEDQKSVEKFELEFRQLGEHKSVEQSVRLSVSQIVDKTNLSAFVSEEDNHDNVSRQEEAFTIHEIESQQDDSLRQSSKWNQEIPEPMKEESVQV